jgi:fatty-acyl-CoA synthase
VPRGNAGEICVRGAIVMDGYWKRPEATAEAAELQAHVRQVRGPDWAPKTVEFRDSLPLTALGKPDRKTLRAPYWEGRNRGVA